MDIEKENKEVKELKILFALNQELNNNLEMRILAEYKKEYGYGFEFDKAINLEEINIKLKDFDLLILNEELQINNQMSLKEIEAIKNVASDTRIILIASSENKSDDFIEKVNSLEIYDLMLSEDISIENIVFLIENPKGKLGQEEVIEEKEVKKQIIPNKIKNTDIKETNSNYQTNKSITIGVGGANNSSGVTHTAIGIASYLKKSGGKIAIIEFNTNPRLANLLIEADSYNEEYLILNRIDIYYQKQNKKDIKYFNEMLSQVKMKGYKYIIIDFGTLKEINSKGIVEYNSGYIGMARTDHQILCLNGSSWKWSDINFYRCDDLAEVEPNIKSWTLSINLVTDNRFRDIRKEVENISVIRKIKKSPIYLNPFNIDESNSNYLEELLKDVVVIENLNKNNGLLKIFENKLN